MCHDKISLIGSKPEGISFELFNSRSQPRSCRQRRKQLELQRMRATSSRKDGLIDSRRVLTRDQAVTVYDKSVRDALCLEAFAELAHCSCIASVQGRVSNQR